MPTTITEIRDFLSLRRIALVGVSRNPKDFSRTLFRDLSAKGYDMVPVNRAASELEGKKCFARVQDIQPPVDGALIMTPASDTERIVQDCLESGIRSVWMYRAGGQGSVSPQAVDLCREKGMHLVEGNCPYMFLPQTPFFHKIHGFILKLTGGYPREEKHAA
jgi:uncharacterized protein